ncbi:MAG TPA: hypothetical protein VKE88_02800, partial [Candidatus Nanoarchaeia archaeon]|nr:hypothetical protein [Candidatus Nanoarchaeia archaeon]
CNACKKRTPLPEMKYSKDGSGLICSDCLNKQIGGVNLRPSSQVSAPGASFAPKQVLEDQKKKVQYTCRACNFRYSRALDYRGGTKICPNCGRDTVSYNLPNDANKLLKELDEMDDI